MSNYYTRDQIPDDLIDFFEEVIPEATPCIVLDPFSGSGTTGRVAIAHNRRYIGVDLSETYLHELTPARLEVQRVLLGVDA